MTYICLIDGVLRLEVSIFLFTLLLSPSLGNWCGNKRSLRGWPSFHGQPLYVRFLHLITFAEGVLLFLIDAICVRGVGSRLLSKLT